MDQNVCPICGQRKKKEESLIACEGVLQHRCPEKILRGIDGTRSVDEPQEQFHTVYERLKDGFGAARLK